MASALAEAHRQTQLRLGALVVRQLRAAFALLDTDDLDGTFEDWLAVVTPIVAQGRVVSTRVAADYLTAARTLAIGERFAPVLADPVDPKVLETSMLVTGPVSIRSNLPRMSVEKAADIALTGAAGAGMRHALNGGRETITGTVIADPRARGWERVASGNACDFCSSRAGARMSTDDVFEAHDRCSCSAAPVYA